MTLNHLYDYRVTVGEKEPVLLPNRRRVAKHMLNQHNKGVSANDMYPEVRKDGEWSEDLDAFSLFNKYSLASAKNGNKPKSVKEATLKSAMRDLAAVLKLALSTDNMSPAHIEAIQERIDALSEFLS